MKSLKSLLLIFLVAFSSIGFAGELKAFAQTEFDKLNADGKGVIVAVHAPWCPTCKVQKPIQSELIFSLPYKEVTMMTIDFDSQKDLLKKFNVTMQSTMIAFKGGKEVGRSVGDTSRNGIEGMFQRTLR